MEKQKSHHFLYFTKRERTGIIVVMFLNFIIYFSPECYDYFSPKKSKINADAIADLKRLELERDSVANFNKQENDFNKAEKNRIEVVYKDFDPNTLSTKGWIEMGINQKTVETINKYLSKGGHFYNPEDLRKIWGLSAQKCKELIPYVKIIKQENSRGAKEFFIHKEKSVTKKSIK